METQSFLVKFTSVQNVLSSIAFDHISEFCISIQIKLSLVLFQNI